MHLPHRTGAPLTQREGSIHPFVIAPYRFGVIANISAKIQGVPGRLADATVAGENSMHQIRPHAELIIRQPFSCELLQARSLPSDQQSINNDLNPIDNYVSFQELFYSRLQLTYNNIM
jgi:hypothetical protein